MWQDDMWSINGTYFVCSSVSLCSELPTCTLPAHQDTQRHTCTHTPSDFFVSRVKSTLITEEAVYCWERPRLCYIIQRVLHFNSEIKQFTQMHKWELIFFFFSPFVLEGEKKWPDLERGYDGQKEDMFLDCSLGLQECGCPFERWSYMGSGCACQPVTTIRASRVQKPRGDTEPCCVKRSDNGSVASGLVLAWGSSPEEMKWVVLTPLPYAANQT